MLTQSIQKYLNQLLAEALGVKISSLQYYAVGGGCINQTFQVKVNGHQKFFLKLNAAAKYPALFEKEKNALRFLSTLRIIRVPAVIASQEINDYQILLLEWIEGGIKNNRFWTAFGEQLAALHRQTWQNNNYEHLFGFSEDNYIGSLQQPNTPGNSWVPFFIEYRLHPQIKMAEQKKLLRGRHVAGFDKLYTRLADIFNDENSALIHGDLWSGNFMCDENADPVLIDPAIYFGNRNMDLAMTTLFGGFDKLFYQSYNHHFPLPTNYNEQWEICNLYPLLIHLNLFGSGYLAQIEDTLRKFS